GAARPNRSVGPGPGGGNQPGGDHLLGMVPAKYRVPATGRGQFAAGPARWFRFARHGPGDAAAPGTVPDRVRDRSDAPVGGSGADGGAGSAGAAGESACRKSAVSAPGRGMEPSGRGPDAGVGKRVLFGVIHPGNLAMTPSPRPTRSPLERLFLFSSYLTLLL